MATVKTTGTTKKTTAKKAASAQTKKGSAGATKAATTGDVKIDLATVAAAVNRLPAPSAAEVEAWRAQYPESYALGLAAQTRAAGVLAEAWGWFQQAEPVLTGELGASIRYAPSRLAFLGHTLLDLAGALESERAKKRSTTKLATAVGAAETLAAATLSELRAAMREAVGRHPTLSNELQTRLAEPSAATTVGALRAIATLLAAWRTSDDPVVHALLASVKLTEADEQRAIEHADAVSKATTARRGLQATERDTPEISTHEGRVLVEMRVLRNAFRNARALRADKRIPALTPGAATRAVFPRAAAEDPTEPTPPPEG